MKIFYLFLTELRFFKEFYRDLFENMSIYLLTQKFKNVLNSCCFHTESVITFLFVETFFNQKNIKAFLKKKKRRN